MNVLESEWLGARLAALPVDEITPLINLGSSTLDFRTRQQPHVDANVFAPCVRRGIEVHHVDLKAACGVDLVGDVLDETFFAHLAALQPRTVLMSNLLEHVVDPQRLATAVVRLLPTGGYLIVSGPKDYPYHADPIDTMYRPTLAEVGALFDGMSMIEGDIVNSGNWRRWDITERGRSLPRTVVRLLIPFYKPRRWWELARQSHYLLKPITAFAAVLRKD